MSLSRVFKTWWPLAASWLLMGLELPFLSAIVARLPEPEINLAAYGGVVFPIALVIESPIIMLLAGSTALSKDWASYIKIRRFMMSAGAILTALHVLVAFTPLYDLLVVRLLGVPAEIVEPARIGLMIMTPWTWSIAFRRFNQGVLIRFGHSQAIGVGTLVRLGANALVLLTGYLLHSVPGIVVGAGAVACGVMGEALYTGWRVRPVLRDQVQPAPPVEPLTWNAFYRFYIPLALTSLLLLIWQFMGSGAISRMPLALESLAVWPVLSGLIFMLRSPGVAYNEVVVALMDEPGSAAPLRRFTWLLAGATNLIHLLIALTPLSYLWFGQVSALEPELAEMARLGLLIALPLPALTVLQSYFQGAIVHSRRTRGIPESVVIFLIAIIILLAAGIWYGRITGLYVGMGAFIFANLAQTAWLWPRSRAVRQTVARRDRFSLAQPAAVKVDSPPHI